MLEGLNDYAVNFEPTVEEKERTKKRTRTRPRTRRRRSAHRKRCSLMGISPFHRERLYQNLCRVTAGGCQLGMRPNHVPIGRNAKRPGREVSWWRASLGPQSLCVPGPSFGLQILCIPNINSSPQQMQHQLQQRQHNIFTTRETYQ